VVNNSLLVLNLPDVLTVKDLQGYLHIGRSKAYHLVKSGTIRHIRIGDTIRIPKVFLLEYLEQLS